VVVNFFGHQLVCHLAEETPARATMYPRHFGICFESESRFFDYLQFCKVMIPEFFFESYFARRVGEYAEHHTFFLADPSNNVIEFKWYKNNEAILG
jgi:extradiol dioxygenase family protein